ncbi:type I-E CRISPR-associated protein Cse1/CasA [Actinomyces wuliandei]|uniref:type I-E CRISPR-associated protein Cse1/CasA n=1 Tax=Actinomyces wuliandei TaxID=2057743 RepID=UPI000FDC6C64|nr:type I-E CRISPR-associated protein Cse1/CasA [Actinomyces wuliandei]
MTDNFNLLDEPWIRVTRLDGTPEEVSLLTAFQEATSIGGIHGEIASQDVAILRLLLAICHRTMGGPPDLETWEAYWEDPALLGRDATAYLERYRDRFDLRHPEHPFFQVAGIEGAVSYPGKIIVDVPKDRDRALFTNRAAEGLYAISWREAARWLIHAHAFDPAGRRSGAHGDPRIGDNGTTPPIGPGWTGQIGVVVVEGANLLHTLLLNTVVPSVVGDLGQVDVAADLPPWERQPDGAVGSQDRTPTGPVDCYTWQTRRLLLHGDGSGVTGLFLGNGDKVTPQNRYGVEPMTAWRYSEPQTKKFKATVFMPRKLPTDRAFWRGLSTLVAQLSPQDKVQRGGKISRYRPPGVLTFYQELIAEEVVPTQGLVPLHAIGIKYGTNDAVVSQLVDDVLRLPVRLLESGNERLVAVVGDAMEEAEQIAGALRNLGGNLARAQGAKRTRDNKDPVDAAQEKAGAAFYLAIDEEFPRWLASLETTEPQAGREQWRRLLLHQARAQGEEMAEAAPATAIAGRDEGGSHIDVGLAFMWFFQALRRVIPPDAVTAATQPADGA